GQSPIRELCPSWGRDTFTNTCSSQPKNRGKTSKERTDGSDQTSAGNRRLHQAILRQVRISADGAGHRQGRGACFVVDGARPSGEPGADRAVAARSVEASCDRDARQGGGWG